jgi:proline iminopeptidase
MTTMSVRGVSLFVNKIGHGYPMVLMHGGPGLDYTTLWSLRACADRFTLIFYDHRCNGRSEGAEQSTMTWENLTEDADALRQTLGFEKWAVLGHSFGGMVAQEYVLRYPERVSHLILMDTCSDAWWVQQNAAELLARRGYSEAAVQAVRRFYTGQLTPNEVTPSFMKFARAYFYHFSLFGMVHEMLFGPRAVRKSQATVFAHTQLLPGWTVMDRLNEIKVRTLVIAGRQDFLFPPEHQAILADRLPNAQLALIEQAGHNPQIERPAEVQRLIRDFLATAPGGLEERT